MRGEVHVTKIADTARTVRRNGQTVHLRHSGRVVDIRCRSVPDAKRLERIANSHRDTAVNLELWIQRSVSEAEGENKK